MEFNEIELSSVITDIAAGPFGSNLKVSCFVPYGFPIIDGANLKGFKVTDNLTKYVTEEKARSLSRSIACRGDVVVTISGTLGQIAYIPSDSMYEEYLCSQRQFRVSFDESKVYVPYLVFYFHTNEGQSKIMAFANQTGVPALSQPLKNFKKIKINLPSYNEQKRIASIIETINNKIECNSKINDNLQQQMSAIYKEKFSYVLQGDTATVEHIVAFSNGKKRPNEEGNIPVYGGNGVLAYTNKFNSQNCIIIGRVGAYCGNVSYSPKECWVSDNAIEAKSKVSASQLFAFHLLKNAELPSRHIGTGQPLMTQGILNAIPCALPDLSEIDAFNDLCEPLQQQFDNNLAENAQLAALRETILPKLMSGELSLSDIEL